MWGCPKGQRAKSQIVNIRFLYWFHVCWSWAHDSLVGLIGYFQDKPEKLAQYIANIGHGHSPKSEFCQSMATPKEQNLSLLFLNFLAWEFHPFTSLLIFFPTLPKPHTWKLCFQSSWCLPAGRAVGRVGLLETKTRHQISPINSQTFPLHRQKGNNSAVNMQGIQRFERNCCSP